MSKEDYVKLFTDAIKKSDIAIVFEIDNTSSFIYTTGIFFQFKYQIDDRIDRMDNDVETNIQKIIGDEYGVSVDRTNAFPNGYAAYTITINS
jgi:hypothetical protein